MSKLRFIKRDGQMILQQCGFRQCGSVKDHVCDWQDVPVHEEPKKPEYVIDNGPGLGLRLIDERLVDRLVHALEASKERLNEHGLSAVQIVCALAEYRKHVK